MGEDATGSDRRDRRRLTVPEVATVLGVTVDAVRGRIRRGKLDSEHDENGTVYVWIDATGADSLGQSPTVEEPSEASRGPSPDKAALIEALRDQLGAQEDQIRYLRDQVEAERSANRENRRLLAAALERIPAIEPPEKPQAPETVAEQPEGVEPPVDVADSQEATERRSWWSRWFGG